MAVCQYFLRGRCKFGDRCINEHPKDKPNIFGVPQSTAGAGNSKSEWTPPFTTESISRDLTEGKDKPIWPFSSYGPAKGEPNLISGLDESPEEMRIKFWQASMQGNPGLYTQYEATQMQLTNSAFDKIRNDLNGAWRQAAMQSPNFPPEMLAQARLAGSAQQGTPKFGQSRTSSLGQSTTPAFGRPAFGQPAFGTSAFGSSSAPAFSQTSGFGAASNPSAFGAFSAFSSPKPGPFATDQPAASVFGQPAPPDPSFAQPSTPTPAFGQASFGGASQGSTAPFGSSAFSGEGAQSAFGSPATRGGFSAFASPDRTSAPFGNPSSNSVASAFATSQPNQTSTFSRPSAFGQSPTFGQTNVTSAIAKPQDYSISTFPSLSTSQQSQSAFRTMPEPAPTSLVMNPFDQLLPPNYMEMMPNTVREKFEAEEFSLGEIPEWIPPPQLRMSQNPTLFS